MQKWRGVAWSKWSKIGWWKGLGMMLAYAVDSIYSNTILSLNHCWNIPGEVRNKLTCRHWNFIHSAYYTMTTTCVNVHHVCKVGAMFIVSSVKHASLSKVNMHECTINANHMYLWGLLRRHRRSKYSILCIWVQHQISSLVCNYEVNFQEYCIALLFI